MAPDLSAISTSTMGRPRATTSAPAMASQSLTPRQPAHGPHISAALPPPGSPPLGTGDNGITRTAQGKSTVAGVTLMSSPTNETRAIASSSAADDFGSPSSARERARSDGMWNFRAPKYTYPSTANVSKLPAGESIDSRAIYSPPADSICGIDSILHLDI